MRGTLRERLHAKTDYGDGAGCWLFTGYLSHKGYGQLNAGDNRIVGAHRVAYELADCLVPDGWVVMHICDVRNCVRPSHLRLGTQPDNIADMVAKGRQDAPRGTGTSTAKLTETQVLEILAIGRTERQVDVAKRYGVDRAQVSAIIIGKTWKHLTGRREAA